MGGIQAQPGLHSLLSGHHNGYIGKNTILVWCYTTHLWPYPQSTVSLGFRGHTTFAAIVEFQLFPRMTFFLPFLFSLFLLPLFLLFPVLSLNILPPSHPLNCLKIILLPNLRQNQVLKLFCLESHNLMMVVTWNNVLNAWCAELALKTKYSYPVVNGVRSWCCPIPVIFLISQDINHFILPSCPWRYSTWPLIVTKGKSS